LYEITAIAVIDVITQVMVRARTGQCSLKRFFAAALGMLPTEGRILSVRL
jgi:hypothetical protein